MAAKRRALTGIKPTGTPHLGNYLGAIRPAIELAQSYEDSFLFIAGLHSLTAQQDSKRLNESSYEVAATWLAFGLDTKQVTFYRQSDIPETTQLAWVLSCATPLGMLRRAHSYKDAQAKGHSDDDINAGLFTYPVLMAADILAFDADIVPVGKDQKQHLEICQEAARKVNNAYGEVLKVPAAKIDEAVMTVPGLDGRKMSKSYDNTILPFETDKQILKRVKQIKTDSTEYGQALTPEGDTVFELHGLLASPPAHEQLRAQYLAGRKDPSQKDDALEDPTSNYFGWGDAKKALHAQMLANFSGPRDEYLRLMKERGYIDEVLREGAKRARAVAQDVVGRVLKATGIQAR